MDNEELKDFIGEQFDRLDAALDGIIEMMAGWKAERRARPDDQGA